MEWLELQILTKSLDPLLSKGRNKHRLSVTEPTVKARDRTKNLWHSRPVHYQLPTIINIMMNLLLTTQERVFPPVYSGSCLTWPPLLQKKRGYIRDAVFEKRVKCIELIALALSLNTTWWREVGCSTEWSHKGGTTALVMSSYWRQNYHHFPPWTFKISPMLVTRQKG